MGIFVLSHSLVGAINEGEEGGAWGDACLAPGWPAQGCFGQHLSRIFRLVCTPARPCAQAVKWPLAGKGRKHGCVLWGGTCVCCNQHGHVCAAHRMSLPPLQLRQPTALLHCLHYVNDIYLNQVGNGTQTAGSQPGAARRPWSKLPVTYGPAPPVPVIGERAGPRGRHLGASTTRTRRAGCDGGAGALPRVVATPSGLEVVAPVRNTE